MGDGGNEHDFAALVHAEAVYCTMGKEERRRSICTATQKGGWVISNAASAHRYTRCDTHTTRHAQRAGRRTLHSPAALVHAHTHKVYYAQYHATE